MIRHAVRYEADGVPLHLLGGGGSAVAVRSVAEEIRDLNAYRRYSPFQTEGEVTAKIHIPATQILECERWDWNRASRTLTQRPLLRNPKFIPPEILSNVRELI